MSYSSFSSVVSAVTIIGKIVTSSDDIRLISHADKIISMVPHDNGLSITIYKNYDAKKVQFKLLDDTTIINIIINMLYNRIFNVGGKYYRVNNHEIKSNNKDSLKMNFNFNITETITYLEMLPDECIASILTYLNEEDIIMFSNYDVFIERIDNILNLMFYLKYTEISKLFTHIDIKSLKYTRLYINKILSNIIKNNNYVDIIESMKDGCELQLKSVEDSLGFIDKLYEGLIKLNYSSILKYITFDNVILMSELYNGLIKLKRDKVELYEAIHKKDIYETIHDYDYLSNNLLNSYIIIIILKLNKNIDNNIKYELLSLIPNYWNSSFIKLKIRNLTYTGNRYDPNIYLFNLWTARH